MADVAATLVGWSSTTGSNAPSDGATVGSGLDDNLREIQGVIVRGLSNKGADIASATTTDLGAVEGLMHDITGTTTITSFGTVRAGIWKVIKFEGALTLTHNATSLILPGAANITTADGDVAIVISEGSGNWRCLNYVMASVSPLSNASNTAAYNAIIGGDFSTNPWQRGTSFAAPAATTYTADRWSQFNNSGAVYTVSKSADAPTLAQAGTLITHCMLIDTTTSDAAVAVGDFIVTYQKIEGYNFRALAQRSMALQFWHKHTKVGTYCVAVQNAGQDRSYVTEYTQAVSDAWEYTSLVIPASPSAGTWDYTTGTGLTLYFTQMAGATYQTAANVWTAGNFYGTANQVNAVDDVANNFRLAAIDLRPGNVVFPVQSRDVGTEKLLAYRYYWEWQAGATADVVCVAQAYNTTQSQGVISLPVTMRVAPTLSVSAAGDFKTLQASGSGSDACSSVTLLSANKVSAALEFTSANLVAGDATRVDAGGSASAKLKFDSEL